jgi:hypothetical protein
MAHARLSHGGTVTGEADAVARAAQIDRSMQAEERQWIADLRARGIKAAHPDDGWVERTLNRVHLCYPQFNDGLAVGDLLALGSPWGETRIVRVTRGEDIRLAPAAIKEMVGHSGPWYWRFEEAPSGVRDRQTAVGAPPATARRSRSRSASKDTDGGEG